MKKQEPGSVFARKYLKLLFWLLLFLVPLGQFQRLQLGVVTALYIQDLVLVALISLWLVYFLRRKMLITLFSLPVVMIVVGFGLIGFLSVCNNWLNTQTFNGVAWLYLFRWIAYSLLLPVTISLKKEKIIDQDLKPWLIWVSILIGSIGLVQYLIWPDTRGLFQLGWDDHLNRLIGSLFDPGFTGLLLTLGFGLELSRSSKRYWVLAFLLTCLVLTYSRATFVSYFAVVTVLSFINKTVKPALLLVALGLFLIALLPRTNGEGVKLERLNSVQSRIASATDYLDVFRANPLLGAGLNTLIVANKTNPLPQHAHGPDNSFVFVLVTTGIVGELCWLLILGYLFFWSFRHSPALLVSLTAITVHSQFNNSFFYIFVLVFLWVLSGNEFAQEKKLG